MLGRRPPPLNPAEPRALNKVLLHAVSFFPALEQLFPFSFLLDLNCCSAAAAATTAAAAIAAEAAATATAAAAAAAAASMCASKLPSRSLAPLYRQFLRACEKTFKGDFEAQRKIYMEMRNVIRFNTLNLSEEDLKKELNMAIDFVRYHIVQAELNEKTGSYKAVLTDDHIKKGDVINLNEIDLEKLKKLPWLKEPVEAKI
ncbi:hypothetical protein, conserved [Eimeria brunetti]|uniref:Uncharacterized protein n=1 Tax=Eimeria brunetti TaxID=51314 RepID=U6LA44_9EIME|nr:hypothetical protein, conserved [Eimeria brunetti]